MKASKPIQNGTAAEQATGRRDFMRVASLGAVATAVTAVTGTAGPVKAAAQTIPASEGYRLTEHVKTYYALARF